MVVVDHNRRILHCSNSVHGAENDIGIAHNDEFVQNIVNGSLQKLEFYLYNEKGQPILTKGGYLITDGGYNILDKFIIMRYAYIILSTMHTIWTMQYSSIVINDNHPT